MTLVEKVKYLKQNYGITYAFIARQIGVIPNRLTRFALPRDNKNYRNLTQQQLARLEEYLSGFTFPKE